MVSIGAATYSKETSERRGVIQHLDRVLVCARKRQEGREFEQARVGAGARVPVSAPSETSKGSDVKMPHLSTNQMCNVRMGFGAQSAVAQRRGAPAEGARLEAGDARLKAGLGGGAALLVGQLGLGGERHVQKHLRRQNQHVRRDAVPAHPVLTLLDSFVETHLLLLGDAVEHDLVVHSRLDVALGTQVLAAVWARPGRA